MAGRFVLQKVVSGMSRSRALVAHAGANAGAAAPERAAPKIQGYVSRAAHTSKTFPNNRWIHGSAKRIFDCSRVTDKTSCLTSCCIPSVITNRAKPAQRTFLSTASTGHEFPESKAKWEAFEAKMAAQDADSKRFWRHIKWLYGLTGFSILLGVLLDHKMKRIAQFAQAAPSCSRP